METRNLVKAATLAKLLKVSTNWIQSKKDRLPFIDIDGTTFYKVKESAQIKPSLYCIRKGVFNNPAKFGGVTMEKEDVDKLKAIQKKDNLTETEMIREALTAKYLGKR